MSVLNADPIIGPEEAQEIFDVQDEPELFRLLNSLSAKARSFLGRVQLNQNLTTPIVERLTGPAAVVLFLHAPVYVADFENKPLTVSIYKRGVVSETLSAEDLEVLVRTDDYAAELTLPSGCFPEATGGTYIEVSYYGGWEITPGEIVSGAIMQGRVELKRMNGEVGMVSRSAGRGSVSMDQSGVISEVADMWDSYRILI